MTNVIYEDNGVSVFSENGHCFITYDAGSHQIAMRKDEISEQQAELIKSDPKTIESMLFGLQRKLIAEGVDPYASNILK